MWNPVGPCLCQMSLEQCFSTVLLPRNPMKGWRLLMEPHAMIRESSGVGKVEVLGCLGPGADVPNGVNRQKTCGIKRQSSHKLIIKQQAKNCLIFAVFDNIWQFYFNCRQEYLLYLDISTLRGCHQQPFRPLLPQTEKKSSLDLSLIHI